MGSRNIITAGGLERRLRKALVAGCLLACTHVVWQMVRNPAFDGWWDAFNWAQLFLYAPYLFFSGMVLWQSIFLLVELFYRKINRKPEKLGPKTLKVNQRTLKFWLQDSLRITALYLVTCLLGDIPMAVNYLAEIRGWSFHWWWSSVVESCLLLMIALWWLLERMYR